MKKDEIIEFLCVNNLLREVIKEFGEDFFVRKLNRDISYVDLETSQDKFEKWALDKSEKITIIKPLALKEKLSII